MRLYRNLSISPLTRYAESVKSTQPSNFPVRYSKYAEKTRGKLAIRVVLVRQEARKGVMKPLLGEPSRMYLAHHKGALLSFSTAMHDSAKKPKLSFMRSNLRRAKVEPCDELEETALQATLCGIFFRGSFFASRFASPR